MDMLNSELEQYKIMTGSSVSTMSLILNSTISDANDLSTSERLRKPWYPEDPDTLVEFEHTISKPEIIECGADERIPYLFVDVNIGDDDSSRIAIYEGDSAESLATKFSESHLISPDTKGKLKDMLQVQMNSVLDKIDEETENSEEISPLKY